MHPRGRGTVHLHRTPAVPRPAAAAGAYAAGSRARRSSRRSRSRRPPRVLDTPAVADMLSLATAATLALGLPAAGASLVAVPRPVGRPRRRLRRGVPRLRDRRRRRGRRPDRRPGHHPHRVHRRGPRRPRGRHRARRRHDHGRPRHARVRRQRRRLAGHVRLPGLRRGRPPHRRRGLRPGLGPSPIAGVTPFAEMDDYLAADRPRRRVSGSSAPRPPRRVADRAGISTAQAAQGFTRAPDADGHHRASPPRRLAQAAGATARSSPTKSSYVLRQDRRPPRRRAPRPSSPAATSPPRCVVRRHLHRPGSAPPPRCATAAVVGFGHPLALLGRDHRGPAPGRGPLRPARLARRAVQGRQPRRRPSAPSPTTG